MLIDEKFHAVSHLKALTNGIDPSSRQRDDSVYIKTMHLAGSYLGFRQDGCKIFCDGLVLGSDL